MSQWNVTQLCETTERDYGSMHMNESPLYYYSTPATSSSSAQRLASQWLENRFQANALSLANYQSRLHELRRAVRLGIDAGSTCTDGVISSLHQLMASGWLNNRWKLVSTDCDHFASEPWEQTFVCCYRNAQGLLSSLFRLPEFRKRLFGVVSAMPSLWKLQALMESAWSLGFDPLGASQLASVLGTSHPTSTATHGGRTSVGLVDSTAWLGASDLVSLFASVGVRCSLLECRAPSAPDGSHPRLLEHIYSYISAGRVSSASLETYSVPMVLQHEGHSRLVIGVELDEFEQPIALILLDPNIPVDAMRQISNAAESLRLAAPSAEHPFTSYDWIEVLGRLRVDLKDLKHPQYQLLQVNGLIETEADLEEVMCLENVTIAIS